MMDSDMELVQAYAAARSEQAFETLVSRHVSLVHSAALRQVRDPQLAEDVTQSVFIILARKAGSLSPKTFLPGWLYRTTRYVSAAALKSQRRRECREQEAHMQGLTEPAQRDWVWEQVSARLDEAMAQLRDKDRDAIVLRYFQNKSLREVGAALGVNEYAAQKRVGRGVEKLRTFFARHGVSLTVAAITAAVSANSVQAAPVGLVKAIPAVALAKGTAASGSTLTVVKGALQLMAWTKAKMAIVAGAVVILAAGTVTPIVLHQHRPKPSIFSSTWEVSGKENAAFVKLTGVTPAQAARSLFEACAREDWTELARYWSPVSLKLDPSFADKFKPYRGLKIVKLGTPYRGRIILAKLLDTQPELRDQLKGRPLTEDFEYGGVFVPYEIQLKDGTRKQDDLAIRCDNSEQRWYWDGGM